MRAARSRRPARAGQRLRQILLALAARSLEGGESFLFRLIEAPVGFLGVICVESSSGLLWISVAYLMSAKA